MLQQPPTPKADPLDTVPGGQRIQSFCWINLKTKQQEWFSCTNRSWFDLRVDTYLVVSFLWVLLLDCSPVDEARHVTDSALA